MDAIRAAFQVGPLNTIASIHTAIKPYWVRTLEVKGLLAFLHFKLADR